MKTLYFGGQKSGKSNLAEKRALELCRNDKPYYIATYDNSYHDKEMSIRIVNHKINRQDTFNTIEELSDLVSCINPSQTYLVDCISMWIMNNIQEDESFFISQLDDISKIDTNVIFVLNDVNNGIIPVDSQSRRFVDLTGIVGQKLSSICNEVFEVKFGLESKLK